MMGYCSNMAKHNKEDRLKKCLPKLVVLALVSSLVTSFSYFHKRSIGSFANIPRAWVHKLLWSNMTSEDFDNAVFANNSQAIVRKACNKSFRDSHFMSMRYVGRTGNLLFQFATLLGVAESTCYTAVLGTETIPAFDEIFDLDNVKRVMYSKDSFKTLQEPGFGIYDESITLKIFPQFNWTLHGYRQSYKYFESYANLIRSSFRFKDTIKARVDDYLNTKLPQYSAKVGVHIRRSDYIDLQAKTNVKYVSDISYINKAIAYMQQRLGATGNVSFVVISDDIPWCKGNVKGADVFYSPFVLPGDDLYLLTQCDHHILTMGTFSWMGAWLNESGIVVYDKSVMLYPNGSSRPGYKLEDHYRSRWIGL